MTAHVIAVIAIVTSIASVVFGIETKRRCKKAERLLNVRLKLEQHDVGMYRRMVRTLGGNLPFDPMYDGEEGQGLMSNHRREEER